MAVGARQIAASSVILLAENVVRLAAVAAVSFWIARRLGPEQFGILNFASSFMAIMMAVAALGTDTTIIVRLSKDEHPGQVLGAALILRLAAAVVVLLFAVVVAHILRRDDPTAFLATCIVAFVVPASVPAVFDFWFKAKTKAAGPALARTISTLISAGAKVACLLMGFGVIALAWTVVLEAVLADIGVILAYRLATSGGTRPPLQFGTRLLLPLLKEGMPYLFSAVASVLYMKADVIMLGYFISNAEVGVYSLAQKLSEVLYIIPVVLIDSAFPSLARRFLVNSDETGGQKLFDITMAVSMAATFIALIAAGPVIAVVFGPSYGPAISVFHIHAWSTIAIALGAARYKWLAVVGLQRYAPIVTALGLAFSLAFNLILIPQFGAFGAAASAVIAYTVSGFLLSFCFPALRQIGFMQARSLWPWGRLYDGARLWRAERRMA